MTQMRRTTRDQSRAALAGLAAAIVAAALPAAAAAQPAPEPPPPRVEGAGEFAFVGVTGNASSQTIGLRFETTARTGTWVTRHRIALVRNEADGVPRAQSTHYGGRLEKQLAAHVSAFVDYEYFRDRFAGIRRRHTGTAGLSARLLTGERQTFAVAAGLGAIDEARLTGASVSSAAWSTSTTYRWKFSATAELADDAEVVGTFDRGDDWRVTHAVSITAELTGALSLKLSSGVRYSHRPAAGFESTDTTTSIALVARFARR
jgi:putative salt-induced outer membrane protein YdiY